MWSPNQEKALSIVQNWLNDESSQVCHMFGYAGTGKTTLAKHLAKMCPGEVLFAAFTGKAAHVLKQKGCDEVSTIHSLIYRSREKSRMNLFRLRNELQELQEEEEPDEEAIKKLSKKIEKEEEELKKPFFVLNEESRAATADLLIIDECSMVDSRLGQDLLSFGTKVLVLGDPAQLPPVKGEGYFTDIETPDVLLEEIHRQAEGSPIIEIATKTRHQELLSIGEYGAGVRVAVRVSPEEAVEFDQILVGRNKTRKSINKRMRELKGVTEVLPVEGDKIVCLRNNHEKGLLNGALFSVVKIHGIEDNIIQMDVMSEDSGEVMEVESYDLHFKDKTGKARLSFYDKKAEEFDYGYALTVHKAQGSQWKKVLLFDESIIFRENRWKWLYTGITRAAEEITIAKI